VEHGAAEDHRFAGSSQVEDAVDRGADSAGVGGTDAKAGHDASGAGRDAAGEEELDTREPVGRSEVFAEQEQVAVTSLCFPHTHASHGWESCCCCPLRPHEAVHDPLLAETPEPLPSPSCAGDNGVDAAGLRDACAGAFPSA